MLGVTVGKSQSLSWYVMVHVHRGDPRSAEGSAMGKSRPPTLLLQSWQPVLVSLDYEEKGGENVEEDTCKKVT